MSKATYFTTKPIDLDAITKLLGEEQKREDDKHVRKGKEQAFYVHHFDRRMTYLFNLPYEQMFVPEKSTSTLSEGKWHCIACAAIGIKDRESHFNWHKRELSD